MWYVDIGTQKLHTRQQNSSVKSCAACSDQERAHCAESKPHSQKINLWRDFVLKTRRQCAWLPDSAVLSLGAHAVVLLQLPSSPQHRAIVWVTPHPSIDSNTLQRLHPLDVWL